MTWGVRPYRQRIVPEEGQCDRLPEECAELHGQSESKHRRCQERHTDQFLMSEVGAKGWRCYQLTSPNLSVVAEGALPSRPQ